MDSRKDHHHFLISQILDDAGSSTGAESAKRRIGQGNHVRRGFATHLICADEPAFGIE